MPIWPFQRSRASQDAAQLLEAVTRASRRAEYFGPGKAPDTLEGRFELTTLFAAVALIRLRRDAGAHALTQSFADALFSQFDAGLREAAVGDLSVPKRMHKLAGQFYGRLGAYASALDSDAELARAISRNVLGCEDGSFAAGLAPQIRALAGKQAEQPVAAMFVDAGWKL